MSCIADAHRQLQSPSRKIRIVPEMIGRSVSELLTDIFCELSHTVGQPRVVGRFPRPTAEVTGMLPEAWETGGHQSEQTK
jgi:hypothetical protein